MRLLNPNETRQTKKEEEALLIRRKAFVALDLEKLEKRMSIAKEAYDPAKQRVQKEYNEFLVQIQSKKSELLGEIKKLEERKLDALRPLDEERYSLERTRQEYEQEMAEKDAYLSKKIEESSKKLERLEVVERTLKEKEPILAKWEYSLRELQADYDKKGKDLVTEEKRILEASRKLTEDMKEIEGKQMRTEADMKVAKVLLAEVAEKQRVLDGRQEEHFRPIAPLKKAYEEKLHALSAQEATLKTLRIALLNEQNDLLANKKKFDILQAEIFREQKIQEKQKEDLARKVVQAQAAIDEIVTKKASIVQEINDLFIIITRLEARKQKALEPLQAIQDAFAKEKEAFDKEKTTYSVKVQELEAKTREQVEMAKSLKKLQKAIDNEKEVLATKKKYFASKEQEVSEKTKEFNDYVATTSNAIVKTNEELEEKQRLIAQDTQVNTILEESLAKEKKELHEYKRKLQDERGTLDRAWQELKTKQRKYGPSPA